MGLTHPTIQWLNIKYTDLLSGIYFTLLLELERTFVDNSKANSSQ